MIEWYWILGGILWYISGIYFYIITIRRYTDITTNDISSIILSGFMGILVINMIESIYNPPKEIVLFKKKEKPK